MRTGEAMAISDESLRNRAIIGSDGFQIGEVVRVFLDTDDLKVVSIEAKLRNHVADQLGAKRSVFRPGTLEIPVGLIQVTTDSVILRVSLAELQKSLATNQPPVAP
jgi:sporulation protein YlmC with PRC-barrel domain